MPQAKSLPVPDHVLNWAESMHKVTKRMNGAGLKIICTYKNCGMKIHLFEGWQRCHTFIDHLRDQHQLIPPKNVHRMMFSIDVSLARLVGILMSSEEIEGTKKSDVQRDHDKEEDSNDDSAGGGAAIDDDDLFNSSRDVALAVRLGQLLCNQLETTDTHQMIAEWNESKDLRQHRRQHLDKLPILTDMLLNNNIYHQYKASVFMVALGEIALRSMGGVRARELAYATKQALIVLGSQNGGSGDQSPAGSVLDIQHNCCKFLCKVLASSSNEGSKFLKNLAGLLERGTFDDPEAWYLIAASGAAHIVSDEDVEPQALATQKGDSRPPSLRDKARGEVLRSQPYGPERGRDPPLLSLNLGTIVLEALLDTEGGRSWKCGEELLTLWSLMLNEDGSVGKKGFAFHLLVRSRAVDRLTNGAQQLIAFFEELFNPVEDDREVKRGDRLKRRLRLQHSLESLDTIIAAIGEILQSSYLSELLSTVLLAPSALLRIEADIYTPILTCLTQALDFTSRSLVFLQKRQDALTEGLQIKQQSLRESGQLAGGDLSEGDRSEVILQLAPPLEFLGGMAEGKFLSMLCDFSRSLMPAFDALRKINGKILKKKETLATGTKEFGKELLHTQTDPWNQSGSSIFDQDSALAQQPKRCLSSPKEVNQLLDLLYILARRKESSIAASEYFDQDYAEDLHGRVIPVREKYPISAIAGFLRDFLCAFGNSVSQAKEEEVRSDFDSTMRPLLADIRFFRKFVENCPNVTRSTALLSLIREVFHTNPLLLDLSETPDPNLDDGTVYNDALDYSLTNFGNAFDHAARVSRGWRVPAKDAKAAQEQEVEAAHLMCQFVQGLPSELGYLVDSAGTWVPYLVERLDSSNLGPLLSTIQDLTMRLSVCPDPFDPCATRGLPLQSAVLAVLDRLNFFFDIEALVDESNLVGQQRYEIESVIAELNELREELGKEVDRALRRV